MYSAAGDSSTRYAVVEAMGIFRQLESPSHVTAAEIITRIVAKREAYEARNARKEKSEAKYYSNDKTYVSEV